MMKFVTLLIVLLTVFSHTVFAEIWDFGSGIILMPGRMNNYLPLQIEIGVSDLKGYGFAAAVQAASNNNDLLNDKDNDDKYYNRGVATNLIYHSNLTSNFIGSGLLNTTVLSVVYITRQDGMINHDIYYSWCKETKLAFPEDLKHTELKNDKALSNIIMDRSIKNKHNNLSVIDSIRNKKEYVWYLPFDKWMMFSAGNVFSRPHKSSYKKPKGISTWKKRKIARRKETRR